MSVKDRWNKNRGKVEDESVEDMTPQTEEMTENQVEASQAEETTQADETPEVLDAMPNPFEKELNAARAQADEYLTLAQRVQADFDNFRKRNESVRADAYADGQKNVAGQFLQVLDNLERALESTQEESPLRSGVELTLRMMRDTYQKMGVKEISRLGEKFDPNLENAVMRGTSDEGEPGTVCMVLQKGYEMNGTVLRYAMVKVVAED
ncbi:MAG: nucleotide exchange factor GrpE [Clostridia bacterium]|nr:nucleotide exchange factor GrpE [Clostridia bacterium]MBR1575931.1 nucleotide exchange factor GrpE [Bacteroidales bacterium]